MIPKKSEWTQKPFPHITVDNYIDVTELLEHIAKEEFIHKKSDLFEFFQSQSLKDKDFVKNILKQIKEELENATGETFSDIDSHATNYEDTNFLLPHDDQLENRRYAYLLYLTDVEEDEGGALALFDDTCSEIVNKIQPKKARLAIFEVSDISYHCVEEVMGDVQRIALGGWTHE